MSWLHTIDVAGFRFVNQTLSHPVLDVLMPFFSGNPYFFPALVVGGIALLWKGGTRGRLMIIMIALLLILGDSLVIAMLKHAVARPRPFQTLDGVHLLAGKGGSASMPSSHAASWFAAAFIAYVFYPRSWRVMLPLAVTVSVSRLYVGVHYPSDVLAGAILGAGYAAAGLWAANLLWQRLGGAWFPEWQAQLPSLFLPARSSPAAPGEMAAMAARAPRPPTPDVYWLRLGYMVIAVLFVISLAYLASGEIELSQDEAYQWLWSKHLALSYYSKPPMIAYAQFLGTSLWGDNAFGVRFLSPVIGAGLSLLLLRFLAREVNARAAFWLVLMFNCTPLLALGATLMTVDPLSVCFWTAAMVAGWRAVQQDSATRHWLWVGLWMGLGLLSKYMALFQLACWALFFWLWPPGRRQLRRPGPYLALAIMAVCALPILIWNAQHNWSTLEHVVNTNMRLDNKWHPSSILKFFGEFVGSELGLLNPVFFVAMLWAMVAFWKRRHPLWLYFFSMGAPVFLGVWLFTLRSRVLPNWIAPSVLPLFCLTVAYWDQRWREGARAVKGWLLAGLAIGAAVVVLLHDTDLIGKVAGRPLPPRMDPLRRVRAWTQTASVVGQARSQLLAEGKDVFIIGSDYGITGEISFYLPEARAAAAKTPLVYYRTTPRPKNQFFFWPGYLPQRRGQNAIYVDETDKPGPPPPSITNEFESVTDLGLREIKYRGRVFHRIQLFACRNLR